MTKEDQIKEVMGLVLEYGNQRAYDGSAIGENDWDDEAIARRKAIESKLRELLQGIGDSGKAQSE